MIFFALVIGLLMAGWGVSALLNAIGSAQGVLEDTMDALSAPKPPPSKTNPDGSSKAIARTFYWLLAVISFGSLYLMFR